MVGGLKTRSMTVIEDMFKNLNQRLQSEQDEMSLTLIMRGRAIRALKASYLDRRAASRCSTCLRKTKWWLLKSWHRRRGVMSSDQPFPLPYLSLSTSFSMWTQVTERRPQINRQRGSCLVSNHAAMTSIWLSITIVLASHTTTTTMNLLSVIVLELAIRDCYAWS